MLNGKQKVVWEQLKGIEPTVSKGDFGSQTVGMVRTPTENTGNSRTKKVYEESKKHIYKQKNK